MEIHADKIYNATSPYSLLILTR